MKKEKIAVEKDAKCEYCDVCGINMTDEGTSVIGVSISIEGKHKEIDRIEKKFGKTRFKVCYVCWLSSLGIKEK